MSVAARIARRPALAAAAVCAALVVLLLALKDQSDKLSVMTASNSDYQRMTDSQTDRLKKLQKQLEEERSRTAAAEKRYKSAESEAREAAAAAEKQINSLRSQFNALQHEHDALKREFEEESQNTLKVSHQVSRLETQNTQLASEAERLRKDLQQASRSQMENSRCQEQYQALFKEHQQATDQVQGLQREKDRLQTQLVHSQSVSSSSTGKKSSSPARQMQLPKSSSTARPMALPAAAHANLEQPFVPNNRISSTSQTPSVRRQNAANVAPVAPAPILERGNQYVQQHQVGREDVMEAPSFFGGLADHQQQQVVHRGHQEDFGQYFHHPGQFNEVPSKQHQPIDRPSMQHQQQFFHHQQQELPYHQAPQHQVGNNNNNIQVRQLPRPQAQQHALHFQRRSPNQQQQPNNFVLADQIDKHYQLPQHDLREVDGDDADDDDAEYVAGGGEDNDDIDVAHQSEARYHAFDDGNNNVQVLQPLNPIQQPAFDGTTAGGLQFPNMEELMARQREMSVIGEKILQRMEEGKLGKKAFL